MEVVIDEDYIQNFLAIRTEVITKYMVVYCVQIIRRYGPWF